MKATLLNASSTLGYLFPRKKLKLEGRRWSGKKQKANKLQLQEAFQTVKHRLEMKEIVKGKQDAPSISRTVAE